MNIEMYVDPCDLRDFMDGSLNVLRGQARYHNVLENLVNISVSLNEYKVECQQKSLVSFGEQLFYKVNKIQARINNNLTVILS